MCLNLGQWVSHYLNVSLLHKREALCFDIEELLPAKPFLGKFITCNEYRFCTIIFNEKGESILKPGRLLTYFFCVLLNILVSYPIVVLNRKEMINATIISQKYCKIKKYIRPSLVKRCVAQALK